MAISKSMRGGAFTGARRRTVVLLCRKGVGGHLLEMAGFGGPESVDTSGVVAGFGGHTPCRPPRSRTGIPVAFKSVAGFGCPPREDGGFVML